MDGGRGRLRAAVGRYVRAMDKDEAPNPFGVQFDGLDFWRAAFGATLKW